VGEVFTWPLNSAVKSLMGSNGICRKRVNTERPHPTPHPTVPTGFVANFVANPQMFLENIPSGAILAGKGEPTQY